MASDEQAEDRSMTRDKPVLQPPGAVPDQNAASNTGRRWIWLVLIMTLAVALAVVFYLPRITITGNDTQEPAVQTPADSSDLSATASTSQQVRGEAQEILREFLRLRARLELENAPLWGEPDWSGASTEAEKGDRFFGRHDYADARDAYRRGYDLLTALDASQPERLAAALMAAEQALANNDVQTAITQFEFARAVEPENQAAAAGLARARVRDDVLGLMQAGRDAERRVDLEAARHAYAQAGQLDGEYAQAAESLHRVTTQINDNRFRLAMGEAISALDAGRFAESGKALDIAAQLKPDDIAVQDLRRRLIAGRKRSALAALRKQSSTRVITEDWQAAAALYQKALVIDPGAAFADEGLKHARDRTRLHKQFDHYLSDPARLYAEEPLANAEKLLASAGSAPADEPRLATKIARLQRQVTDARTPVLVNLRSDGQTDVVIYHVGRRGRFQQQQLELRPGTYTAMGSRAGYRDVRKVFEVKPGTTSQAIMIKCEEPI